MRADLRQRAADWPRALPAWPLLGLICLASASTLVILGTRLTFFNDDWYLLLQRPGVTADSLLAPINGHLEVVLLLAYKSLVALFGLDFQLPFRLVLAAAVESVGIIVYVLVRERAGRLLGLLAATIVVFLGPAWEGLLWFACLDLIGSLAFGLAALQALERDTPRRNAIACFLLVCSVALFSLGIAFIVAAAIAVVLRRRFVQLWIPAIPGLLWGIWWAFYGSDAPPSVSAVNLEHLPRYMIDAASLGLASIVGLNRGSNALLRGHVLLVIAALATVAWLLRGGRPSRWLVVFVGAALTFWGLTGAAYVYGRTAAASRYQLVNAALLILIAAELFRTVRLRPWQTAAVAAVALFALASNVDTLVNYGFGRLRDESAYAKADLGALEITRGVVPRRRITLVDPVARHPFLAGVTSDRYLSETEAHGSPVHYSPAQLATAPPAQRQAADNVLAAAYSIVPRRARRPYSRSGCRRFPARSRDARAEVEIPSGGALLTVLDAPPLVVYVRRFAPSNDAVAVGFLAGRSTSRLAIPRDSALLPWRVTVSGMSAVEICPQRAQ